MSDLWPLLVIGSAGVVLTVVYLNGRRLFPGTRLSSRRFWCPFRRDDVAVAFQESVWEGALLDVSRCTCFTPPSAVDCHKHCLQLGFLPPVRGDRATMAS
jgi:hypothetical protein